MTPHPHSLGRIACAIGLVFGLASLPAASVLAEDGGTGASERQRFDVPAGSLSAALNALARQAGVVLVYPPSLTAGKSSPGLVGDYALRDGFAALLANTGLETVHNADGSYGLRENVQAQTAAGYRLAPVTVLGARDPNVPLSNVPASISVVSREDVATEQATAERIEDILGRQVPGFNPTNNGIRQIRGRTAQVFINGVPTNEQLRASAGADLNLLAPDQLDMIEVSRGANAAYGFGSPGGIIALTTPRAESEELTLRTKVGTSFNTSQPGGSFQTSLYQGVAQIVGDFDFHVGVSLRRDGLNHDPDGRPANDSNSPALFSNGTENVYNLDTSLGYDLGDAGSLRLTATAGRVDVDEFYESDFAGVDRSDPSNMVRLPAGDDNYRRHHTASLTYENPDIGGHALKLELLASKVRSVRHSDTGAFIQRDEQVNEYQGFRTSVTSPLAALHDGASISYGIDFMRNRYFRPWVDTSTGQVVRYLSPDSTLDSWSPYLQGQFDLGKLRLNAGIRHERYSGEVETAVSTSGRGDIEGGDIDSFDLTLLNVGAVYALERRRELYASFSQGAEVSQLGRTASVAGSADRIDPKPAKSNQYEVGFRQRGDSVDYTLAAYYTESDLMSALDCSNPTEPCTPLREPREFWGVEGTLAWRVDSRWTLGGTLSWMDGKRELPDGSKRRIGSAEVPPLLLAAYVGYAPRDGWTNRLQFDYRAARDVFGDSGDFGEGRVEDELLVHAMTSVDVGKGQLQLGVRNLFDETYYAVGAEASNRGWAFIPEEGRRVSLSYTLDW